MPLIESSFFGLGSLGLSFGFYLTKETGFARLTGGVGDGIGVAFGYYLSGLSLDVSFVDAFSLTL